MPFFCLPLSQLFNLSLSSSTVPHQWKQEWIRPSPNVSEPTQPTSGLPVHSNHTISPNKIIEIMYRTSFRRPFTILLNLLPFPILHILNWSQTWMTTYANMRHNQHHVLYKVLPDKTDHTHSHVQSPTTFAFFFINCQD